MMDAVNTKVDGRIVHGNFVRLKTAELKLLGGTSSEIRAAVSEAWKKTTVEERLVYGNARVTKKAGNITYKEYKRIGAVQRRKGVVDLTREELNDIQDSWNRMSDDEKQLVRENHKEWMKEKGQKKKEKRPVPVLEGFSFSDDEEEVLDEEEQKKFANAKVYLPKLDLFAEKSPERKALQRYLDKVMDFPSVLCGSCHLLFRRSAVTLRDVKKHENEIMREVFPDVSFSEDYVEEQFVCLPCWKCLVENNIPVSSWINGLEVDHMNCEPLRCLNPLELAMISSYRLLIRIIRLPSGNQKASRGYCVQLTSDVDELFKILPVSLETAGMIFVKNGEFSKNIFKVDGLKLRRALTYLVEVGHPGYEGIVVDEELLREMELAVDHSGNNSSFDLLSHDLRTTGEPPVHVENVNTVFALPKIEGKFISRRVKHWEARGFPNLYPTGKGDFTAWRRRRITLGKFIKNRMRHLDSRFRSCIPYVLAMSNFLDQEHASSSIGIAGSFQSANFKKKDLQSKEGHAPSARLFAYLQPIRGSFAYWQRILGDLIARFAQFGPPTFFLTLSANDYGWPDIMCAIWKDHSPEAVRRAEEMPYPERERFVRENPVLVVEQMHNRFRAIIDFICDLKGIRPLGIVLDYFARVEFQFRGTPHLHMFIWIKDAPDVEKLSTSVAGRVFLSEFIDKYISCRIPDEASEPVLCELVKRLQKHACTFTCKSKSKWCRFNFPQKTSENTIVNDPALKGQSKKFYMLKRSAEEVRINAYNKLMLLFWGANMDLQLVRGEYGLAMYVVQYIAKGEPADIDSDLVQLYKSADNIGNSELRSLMGKIASQVIGRRLVSQQEAALKCLVLPLTYSSRSVIFLDTRDVTKRTRFLKWDDELEPLEDEDENLFKLGMVDYYYVRPKTDEFEDMCAVRFFQNYTVKKSRKGANLLGQHSDKKVVRRLVARCVKMRDTPKDIEDCAYHFLYAFLPRRGELVLPGEYHTFVEYYDAVKEQLDIDSMPFIHLAARINKSLAKFDRLKAENVEEFMSALNDVELEEESLDGELLRTVVDDICASRGGEILMQGACPMKTGPAFSVEEYRERVKMMSPEQATVFHEVFQSMKSGEQQLLFVSGGGGTGKSFLIQNIREMFVRYNPDKATILLCGPTGVSAYNIGGRTLNSTFKLDLEKSAKLHLETKLVQGRVVEKCSLKPATVLMLRDLYKDATHIVIDEISMVSDRVFVQIDLRCRLIFNSKKPFGGRSVILVGDFCQLNPVCGLSIVVSKENFDCAALWSQFKKIQLRQNQRQKGDKVFLDLLSSLRFGRIDGMSKQLLEGRVNAHLHDVEDFKDAVHIFTRNKDVDRYNEAKLMTLKGHVYVCEASQYCKNGRSDEELIPKKSDSCGGVEKVLALRIGAKVMLLRNQAIEDGCFNGAMGTVYDIKTANGQVNGEVMDVEVVFDGKDVGKRSGRLLPSGKYVVSVRKQIVEFTGGKHASGTTSVWVRKQFPLRLAWASTVHKVQGLTLPSVVLYLEHLFCFGVVYVALSRVCSLNCVAIGSLDWRDVEKSLEKRPMADMRVFYDSLTRSAKKRTADVLLGVRENVGKMAARVVDIIEDHRNEISKEIDHHRSTEVAGDDYQRAMLNSLNLVKVHVVGDGNCQYSSISYFVFNGDLRRQRDVRQRVFEEIRDHRALYEPFIGRNDEGDAADYETQLREVLEDRAYGNELTLNAAARVFGFDFDVVRSDNTWESERLFGRKFVFVFEGSGIRWNGHYSASCSSLE